MSSPLWEVDSAGEVGERVYPLHVDQWESLLARHPDRNYVEYNLTGIKEGFRVGFKDVAPLSSAWRNMQSAVENSQEYLVAEISRGVLWALAA